MAQDRRILFVSHTPTATTGYGRVTRRLAHAFHNAGHRVTALGSGYNGETHDLSYPILPWPNDRPAESLAAALRDIRPDVLLTIGDPWMFDFVPVLPERASVKWIAYFPVDGRPLLEEWKRWIRPHANDWTERGQQCRAELGLGDPGGVGLER